MNLRYKVRMYESGDGDCCVTSGTIVMPVDRGFTVYAESADEAEKKIETDVVAKKLTNGRVYQIRPEMGNMELTRSVAICEEGTTQRIFLDPALGLYSEFRRIRNVGSDQPTMVGVAAESEKVEA